MKRKGVLRSFNNWLFIFGVLFLLSAIGLTFVNLHNDRKGDEASKKAVLQLKEVIPGMEHESENTSPSDQPGNATPILYPTQTDLPSLSLSALNRLHSMPMPTADIDGELYIGIVSIPKLDLELPVMSDWSYEKLKISPCLFSGSVYAGNAVIAAHNYRSHFRRITELSPGDGIMFTDVQGNVFHYTVAFGEVLQPTDIEDLTSGDFELTLFTCTIGGKLRYTVRCSLIKTIFTD